MITVFSCQWLALMGSTPGRATWEVEEILSTLTVCERTESALRKGEGRGSPRWLLDAKGSVWWWRTHAPSPECRRSLYSPLVTFQSVPLGWCLWTFKRLWTLHHPVTSDWIWPWGSTSRDWNMGSGGGEGIYSYSLGPSLPGCRPFPAECLEQPLASSV